MRLHYPVLSKQEEYEIAVNYHENGDLEAANKLVLSNLRFVMKIAGEYKTYGFPLMDLIQEGTIGLMHAVKKFNPYKGYRLISYAVWWIKARIHGHIMKFWSSVKIGTTQAQRKLFQKLRLIPLYISNKPTLFTPAICFLTSDFRTLT